MTKQGKQTLLVVGGVFLLFAMSSEFASMAKQLSLGDALISFVLLTLIVVGAVYWIKKARKGK
jgi:hypothetical protein